MSIDIVGAISKVYEVSQVTIFRLCGYAVFCKSHASDLKNEIKNLKNASNRIQHRVDHAENAKEIIEDDVWMWLTKANELIVSGNQILQKTNISCFGFVPNPKARYVLGRRAKKCLITLKEHLDGGKFDEVSFQSIAEPNLEIKVRSGTSSTVRHVELKSRELVLKKIVSSLDDHKKLGVCGMGGVGKTTLLKEVEKLVKESGKFDDVVNVLVSQAPDIEGINSKIRNKLKRLESSGDDAGKKTLLILLDDLWEDFKSIGVLEKEAKVKVKWVMTSRKQNLLAKEMFCHPIFSLGVLDDEEGWHLFRELVMNNKSVEDLKKNPATVELLQKCAGLPVSIQALATIWKKKVLSSTDIVRVKKLNLGKELEDGSGSLELSYTYLKDQDGNEEAKLLFRTIGLLGTPIVPILTLLKYTVGMGLFGSNANETIMKRARREVTKSICTLQESSLLLESDDSIHVKIHDLVRDVAIRIACNDDHALIFNPEQGVESWSRENMQESTIVSLPYSALSMLSMGWKCPNAKIFIIGGSFEKGDHVELPDSFFKGMVKLKIIDLRNARLTSLPSSIQSDLHNLTTLCLDYCYLEDVAAIGKLKSLKVLSFVGSEIGELPKEIGELTNLRMLDLSKCLKLESIKPDVLGRLTRLEELYLKESFDRWEIEGDGRQQINSSLDELSNMVQLSTLEIRVRDDSKLPPTFPLGDLVQYKVLMGDIWDWSGEYKESRTLKLKVKWDNIMTEEWLQSALQKVQDFHLDGLSGTKESFHEVCWEGFKELKHLHLQNCSSIKSIVWSIEWLSCSVFTTLESMHLENLESLDMICNGLINPDSFSKLKIIRVQYCHKLRCIFNISFIKSLQELEEIEISDCNMVQEIFIAEKMDDGGVNEHHKKVVTSCSDNLLFCPIKRSIEVSKTQSDVEEGYYELNLDKLHSLTLRNLPELTSFFTKETPSSDSTDIPLPTLFNEDQVSLHRNAPLKLCSHSKFKEISSSAHLGLSLGNLRQVVVENCNKIVNFMDFEMLLKLGNLESLTIARCQLLEDIFDLERIEAKSGNIEILPKLSELKLRVLPKLAHIWKENLKQIKGCQNLRNLEIYHCDSLSYLFGSSMCKGMKNLAEINIVKCDMMETIILEEDGSTKDVSTVIRLTSLKNITISECPTLKTFLSSNIHTTSNHVHSCLNLDYSKAFKCSSKSMSCWCSWKQDSIRGDATLSFFSNKVSLPSLESLFVSSSGKFETLWCTDLPTDRSYYNLEVVNVERCDTLSVVFPATLIERLQKLKQLRVTACMKLRTVINLDVDWNDEKRPKVLMLSQLQKLSFSSLENMTHVMEPGDSHIVVAFTNLKEIDVYFCSKLLYLIPISTATTLLKLESLTIGGCKELREVIHEEVVGCYERNVINFPHLIFLTMWDLQSLIHFSSESYLFDFMRLKRLEIRTCGNLKTLVKPTSSGQDSGSQTTIVVQALFNNKVDLPNLEILTIENTPVEELWCNEPLTTSFCKLKSLKIYGCQGIHNIIPSFIIKRLQNLETLEIRECELLDDIFWIPSNEEIQSVHDSKVLEGLITEEKNLSTDKTILLKLTSLTIGENTKLSSLRLGSYSLQLTSLKELRLNKTIGDTVEAILEKAYLPNLEKLEVRGSDIIRFWHNEPHVGSFCKLRHLEVKYCAQLTRIIPLFMWKRMHHLEKLEVESCNKLQSVVELGGLIDAQESENKFSHSPLVNLTSIRVEHCKSLKSLFTISERLHECGDTSECHDDIVLRHLTKLRLTGLPNFSDLFQVQGQYLLDLSSVNEFVLSSSGAKEAVTRKVIFAKELKICEHVHDDITFFGSTTTIVKDIIKALHQTEKNRQTIGLIGKLDSFVALELVRIVKEEKMFDEVVVEEWTNIQKCIGGVLGIVYGVGGEQERAQRLRKSLLSNHDKRLLLILNDMETLKAAGVPSCEELDPRFFKQIVISTDKDSLMQMRDPLFIDIGCNVRARWKIIANELKASNVYMAFSKQQQELQVETNIDNEISSFIGPNSNVMNHIINALRNSNNQIIGLFGQEGIRHYCWLFRELGNLLAKFEAKLFDDIVNLDGKNEEDKDLSCLFSNISSDVTYNDPIAGLHERTQHLRQKLLDNKEKRFLLVILRDMDHELHLDQLIGIPLEGLESKLLKIIIFSKNREVLHKMGAQQVIDITNMSSDYLQYYRILDGYVEGSDLRKLADECGRDDLAELLAKKLSTQGLRAWENAFQCLKDTPFEYEARRRVIDSL